jgi:hypothetical protein
LADAHGHGHVGAPGELQQLRGDARPVLGVAGVGADHLKVNLRATEHEGQRPGVVNVAADVGVEDGGDGPKGHDRYLPLVGSLSAPVRG